MYVLYVMYVCMYHQTNKSQGDKTRNVTNKLHALFKPLYCAAEYTLLLQTSPRNFVRLTQNKVNI